MDFLDPDDLHGIPGVHCSEIIRDITADAVLPSVAGAGSPVAWMEAPNFITDFWALVGEDHEPSPALAGPTSPSLPTDGSPHTLVSDGTDFANHPHCDIQEDTIPIFDSTDHATLFDKPFGTREGLHDWDDGFDQIDYTALNTFIPARKDQNVKIASTQLEAISLAPCFACSSCSQTFERQCDLNHHNKRKHLPYDQRPVACGACDKRFLYPKDLRRHSKVHNHGNKKRKRPLDDREASSTIEPPPVQANSAAMKGFASLSPKPAKDGGWNSFSGPFLPSGQHKALPIRNRKARRFSESHVLDLRHPSFPDDGSAPHRGARV